jgi:hypothetical protein
MRLKLDTLATFHAARSPANAESPAKAAPSTVLDASNSPNMVVTLAVFHPERSSLNVLCW